jgi:hypothetical protein
VLVYNGKFSDQSLYRQSEIIGREDDGTPFKCLWQPLEKFRNGDLILYPKELINIIDSMEVENFGAGN